MHTLRPDDPGRWTIDRLHELPEDGNRYELVAGELLVTPAPAFGHQLLISQLLPLIQEYVRRHGLGAVVAAPNEVQFLDTQEAVQPDLMVIPTTAREARGLSWRDLPRPTLVVEILSPSTRGRDLVAKRHLYMRERIPTYWMVDGDSRSVRVACPSDEDVVVSEFLVWHPTPEIEELSVDLRSIFDEALGPK